VIESGEVHPPLTCPAPPALRPGMSSVPARPCWEMCWRHGPDHIFQCCISRSISRTSSEGAPCPTVESSAPKISA